MIDLAWSSKGNCLLPSLFNILYIVKISINFAFAFLSFASSLPLSGVLSRAGRKRQGGTSNAISRALRKPKANCDQVDKAPAAIRPVVLAANARDLVIECQ